MNFEFLTFQTSSAFQGSSSSIAASTFQRSSSSFQSSQSFQSSAQPVFIEQSSAFQGSSSSIAASTFQGSSSSIAASTFQGSLSSIAASTFQRSSSSSTSSLFLPHLPRLSLPRPAENEISVHFKDHADVEAHDPEEVQDGYNSFTSQFFDTSEASDRWKEVVDASAVFPDDASVDLGNINGKTELFPGSPHRLKVFVIFCILFFSSTSLLTSKCL
jgi:hypothetical protein